MKLNNRDAYQLYLKYTNHLKKLTPKSQKCDVAASKFIEEHVPSGDHKLIHRKFEWLFDGKPGSKATGDSIQKWEETEFFEIVAPNLKTKNRRKRDDQA